MKTITLPFRNSIKRSPLHCWTVAAFLIPLALVCFGLAPQARATCQQGCLSANNTVLGDDALVNNFLGGNNTAVGFDALLSNTNGNYNTATGYQALYSNTTGLSNTANGANALQGNTTGFNNTATGSGALLQTSTATGTQPPGLLRSN